MPGRVVIQWDKDDCADMGIVKVDLLGLGMMAALQDAIELVNTGIRDRRSGRTCGSPIPIPIAPIFDLAHIPTDDRRRSTRCCRRRDTIGVFQVESRAQMATLPRLKPTHFYDLVVEVAIIRPGPIVGAHGASVSEPPRGTRAGRAAASRRSSRFSRARSACRSSRSSCCAWRWWPPGFTGGQAEELRRAMGFKRSEKRMKQIEVQLREGMAQQRHHRRDRGAHHHVDHVVRAVRLSRVARGELRAARVCERVSQGALPGGVLHGAPQQPADGVLSPGDARQGRAAPRRPVSSDRRAAVRTGLCRVEEDGAIRLGFMHVNGLRKEVGQAMAADSTRAG